MATVSALGGSPVSFVDANGVQYTIPLAWITLTTSGPGASATASAAGWPGWSGPAAAQQAHVTKWLGSLVAQGLLWPGPAPPNPPAFTITARDAGSEGNAISVAFTNVYPNATMDVTVSVTQTYQGLTITGIETVLGTSTPPVAGTQPGLAQVGTTLTALPTAGAPMLFKDDPTKPPQYVVPSSNGILVPTHDTVAEAADAGLIAASITSVNSAAGTFTLTLTWTKTVTGVALSALGASFGYVLTVAAPSSGFGPTPAANTSVALLGGTDGSGAVAAVAATAAVISA